ncbi:hypothetical protein Pelo_8253 [Pelomyxa schiedti]|nr:hypothetical protein Pelo_8253 [Pelomyxa schiedti]
MTSPTSAPSPLPSSAPPPPPPSSSAEATAAAAVAVPVVVVDRGAQLERAVMQSHIVWSMLLPRWLPCCRPTTCPVGFTTWRYDRSTMFDDDSLTTNITLSEGFDMLTVVAEAMFPLYVFSLLSRKEYFENNFQSTLTKAALQSASVVMPQPLTKTRSTKEEIQQGQPNSSTTTVSGPITAAPIALTSSLDTPPTPPLLPLRPLSLAPKLDSDAVSATAATTRTP